MAIASSDAEIADPMEFVASYGMSMSTWSGNVIDDHFSLRELYSHIQLFPHPRPMWPDDFS